MSLTHLNEKGEAQMVDVGGKPPTDRIATAAGEIHMRPKTLAQIIAGNAKKGDVLGVARVAGIMAAKHTHELIPLCHPLLLTKIGVDFEIDEPNSTIRITATVKNNGQTGVEMEALTAVSVAALTIYDMAKAMEKTMIIDNIRLLYKEGGKSGVFRREDA